MNNSSNSGPPIDRQYFYYASRRRRQGVNCQTDSNLDTFPRKMSSPFRGTFPPGNRRTRRGVNVKIANSGSRVGGKAGAGALYRSLARSDPHFRSRQSVKRRLDSPLVGSINTSLSDQRPRTARTDRREGRCDRRDPGGGAGAHFDDKCNLNSWTTVHRPSLGHAAWMGRLGSECFNTLPRQCAKFPSVRSE